MTGPTAVHMSRPVVVGGVQYSGSNDDSSEEPFDQKPSQKQQQTSSSSNNMRSEEYLDDGELPSLTRRSKVTGSNNTMLGGRVINGQRTTTRPLNPPNLAGLKVGREQREFWGQLDKGEDDDAETWDEEEDYRRGDEADVPDDELRGTRTSKRRSGANSDHIRRHTDGKSSRKATARRITDDEEESSSIGRKDTYDSSEYDDEELEEESHTYLDNNYCDQTLSALMDMCGKGLSIVKTQSNHENTNSIHSSKGTPREGESPEEHTAIEVEFVEPTKGNLSPQRKNAYLTALARKAKIDFNKKKELSASNKTEANSVSPQDVTELYSQDEDVYHSFSASEKRKFLKLINTGVPPAQAQYQVLQDRSKPPKKRNSSKKIETTPIKEEEDEEEQNEKESEEVLNEKTPEEAKSPNSKSGKLAFWKKTRSRRLAARKGGLVTPDGRAVDTTYPESESEDSARFAKSGINYYDGIRREGSDDESAEDISGVAASSSSQNRPKRRPKPPGGVGFAALRDRRAQSAPRPRTLDPSLLKEDESSIDGVPPQVTPSPEKNKSSSAAIGSGVAFAALRERRSKSTPRGRYGELSLPPPSPGKAATIREAAGNNDMEDDAENDSKAPATPLARTVEDLLPQGPKNAPYEMDHVAELEKIEQELLKAPLPTKRALPTPPPSPPAPPGNASVTKSTKELPSSGLESSTKPTSSAVNEMIQTPAIGKKKREVSVQVDGLNVSIDTYMNSRDMYATNKTATSSQSYQNPNDSVSVYTMGTGATGVTGGTTHTQSSRVYRRGVAKERLAKAKEVEDANKGKGWHETIRKAAESTNRKWEPKAGWVDYEEPKIELPAAKSSEKIHIDLNKSLTSHKEVEGQIPEKGTATPVPFPKDWEKERNEMIEDAVDLTREVDSHHEEKKLETPIPTMQDGQYASIPQDPNKPRGWLETMKAASASLAPEGHTWDPQHGWTKVGESKDTTEDTVDFGAPSHARSLDLPDKSRQEILEDSQVLQISQSAPVPEKSEVTPPAPHSAIKDSDKKLNQWIAKVEQGPKKRSERSTESSDRAVASAGTERYIQLGDNGSIRSHTHGAPRPAGKEIAPRNSQTAESSYISDDETEVDSAPLLSASGAFPSVDDRPLSPIVGIVTEKVGAEDMDLFPVEPPKPKRLSGGVSRVVPEIKHPEDTSLAETSMRSSRRGAGPVDTDEVDETWDSDDEQRCSSGWETDSKSASLELSYTRTKPIPKLSRSKRDTSPLTKRTPSKSDGVGVAFPVQRNMDDSIDAAEQDIKDSSGSSSVRARREQWENRTEKTESILHDLSASESRLQDSPSRNKNSPGTAEWKSFLGKKVRAESAAAAGKTVTESKEERKKEPEGGKVDFQRKLEKFEHPPRDAKYQDDDDDDDSLFEFSDKQAHSKSPAGETATFQSDLSPIRTRGEEFEREPSEAYGPEEGERGNFFKRLAECAAPVMPTGQGSFVPPNLCSRPDWHKEDEASFFLEDLHLDESPEKGRDINTRSKSAPRPRTQAVEATTSSSVVSEDFGAKTAYLEAIAMKAAVSKPRSSSRKRSSGSSVVSSTSSAHSEKWKAFLERKRASGRIGSSAKTSSTSSVSQAAEKYAAEKVEEMMSKMASRGSKERQVDDMLNKSKDSTKEQKRVESIKAAEDLAAARVEAMMAALSNSNFDEGEI